MRIIIKTINGFIKKTNNGTELELTLNLSDASKFKDIIDFLLFIRFEYQQKVHRELNEHITIIDTVSGIEIKTSVDSETKKITDELNTCEDQTFTVSTEDFYELLKLCNVSSSQFFYDKDDKWIAFPKKSDFNRIEKIGFMKRGLSHNFECIYKYLPLGTFPSCYSYQSYRNYLNIEIVRKIVASKAFQDYSRIYFLKKNE